MGSSSCSPRPADAKKGSTLASKKTTPAVKKGDIVRVRFWDHASGQKPMEFYCFGRVSRVTKLSIVLETWAFVNQRKAKAETTDLFHNQDHTTLIRSTITEITHYAPERQSRVESSG